jgi:hypothetical protein
MNPLFQWLIIIGGSILLSFIFFILNNLTGIFTLFLVLILVFIGILVGIWDIRIGLAYLSELRKKKADIQIGIPRGWALFGLVTAIVHFTIWGLLSSLTFNFPKIVFLIPGFLGIVQIFYTLLTSNRADAKDLLILAYNIFAFYYLFSWTLVDFGVDLPSIFGFFQHVITTTGMWWQVINVNSAAFFNPTFIFPIILLNPRYFATPKLEDYLQSKEDEIKSIKEQIDEELVAEAEELVPSIEEREQKTQPSTDSDEKEKRKRLPGDRIPFFEERRKQEKITEEIKFIQREMERVEKGNDSQFAEYLSTKDFRFKWRKYVNGLEKFVKYSTLFVIIILGLIMPFALVGNISMHTLPKYEKYDYVENTDFEFAVIGNVFSATGTSGSFSSSWENDLVNEITWAKELHATHIRYNIKANVLSNDKSLAILVNGSKYVQNSGLKLILAIKGNFSYQRIDYLNTIYLLSNFIAENIKPDKMIVFNEINWDLQNKVLEKTTMDEWIVAINNISSVIKSQSPSTEIGSTLLATADSKTDFVKLLGAETNLDFVGVNFFPILYNWRFNILKEYSTIYSEIITNKSFWLTAVGVESFNYGEVFQARFLAKILSLASNPTGFNATGVCIESLQDNLGNVIEQGITSHLGLVYFNGNKKLAFQAVKHVMEQIYGL